MGMQEEETFMKTLLTTWGKTWHTWPDPTTNVPVGEPLLMWAVTGDGQADTNLVAERDTRFGISTAEVRKRRIADIGYDVPQIPPPANLNVIGRQWTATGEDKPLRSK